MEISFKKSLKKFYEEGIGKSKVQWTIAAAATPAWCKKVFPDLNPQEACSALWEEIFRICRVDKRGLPQALERGTTTFLLQEAKSLMTSRLNTCTLRDLVPTFA